MRTLVWEDGESVVRDMTPAEIAEMEARRLPAQIPTLTRRQVFIGMAAAGLITAPEAIAAASIGKPPAAVEAAFLLMPAADQTAARITFGAFQTAYREDPMTALFQATAKMTDAQMDTFFTTFAAV